MIHPRIDELLNTDAGGVDSRYALVIVAAKRARQINNYHHQLEQAYRFRYMVRNDDVERATEALAALIERELQLAATMARP